MRISDWSSDVCSSDLPWRPAAGGSIGYDPVRSAAPTDGPPVMPEAESRIALFPGAEPLAHREPPHNLEAEQALLGAVLVNNRAYERVSEFLRPEHFADRSEEHTSELQSLMRISYAVFCLKTQKT